MRVGSLFIAVACTWCLLPSCAEQNSTNGGDEVRADGGKDGTGRPDASGTPSAPTPTPAPTSTDPGAEPDPNAPCSITVDKKGFLGTQTVVVDWDPRTYEFYISPDYDGHTKLPLFLVFHGDYMTGNEVRSWFQFESGPSFIVAYPNAHTSWDIDSPAYENADLKFVDAMIDDIASKVCIDRNRIFSFGNSNGGFFSNSVGCHRGRRVRGIVSLSGGGPTTDNPLDYDGSGMFIGCSDSRSTSALMIHGDLDPKISIQSGRNSRDYWLAANKCSTSWDSRTPAPCVSYQGCQTGNIVEWCELSDFGHEVWPSTQEAIWNFVDQLR
ncbi:hypothetical protein AKJ09_09400 [Labilithrix luteola]|uniref:Uncharacterized protein n=1 Tax=Labilithrix luteola TaxID=1391654 RepID=A0A0K1QAQ2_9BACT|nr:hypothetical protein [Labilithrix luteola]AKV02737.1 hypothetical protein AKJ09_09400 [Labilithrix luteola]